MPKADRPIGARERWILEHVPGAHWLRRTGLYWLFESRVLASPCPEAQPARGATRERHLAKVVPDPALRAKLTPNYRLGCKRVLISNDFYPALQRDNVELVTIGSRRSSRAASGPRTAGCARSIR